LLTWSFNDVSVWPGAMTELPGELMRSSLGTRPKTSKHWNITSVFVMENSKNRY